MTDERTFDKTITTWLEETAPTALPDHVLTATFERTRRSRQDVSWRQVPGSLRTRRVSPALGGAAAVVVAAAILALNTGLVLGPGGLATPSPSVAASPSASPGPSAGYLWPQTTLEEVEAAQKLLDAGDPTFRWQTSARWHDPGQNHPFGDAFFARFLEDELGWTAYRWNEELSHSGRDGLTPGDVVFIRCAPDAVNPLYPNDADGGCRPTLDDLRYETVKIHVEQPVREGGTGLWVVTGWDMVEPAEQIAPPAEAEVSALLESFFQARIGGGSVDAFVDVGSKDPFAEELASRELPLLRAASGGAPYVRWTSRIVSDPVWPTGRLELDMTLFTDKDQTQVVQRFALERDAAARLHLVYASSRPERTTWLPTTTENGTAVPVEYRFLEDLTYRAAAPLRPSQDGYRSDDRRAIEGVLPDDGAPRTIVIFLANPRPLGPGCVDGPVPANAEGLARSIAADPNLRASSPIPVRIGGRPALRLDVVRATSGCRLLLWPAPFTDWDPFRADDRVRIHLVDLPGAPGRILAIITKADADSFETVLAAAAPIIASIEFRAP